jgi:hypothetical protein
MENNFYKIQMLCLCLVLGSRIKVPWIPGPLIGHNYPASSLDECHSKGETFSPIGYCSPVSSLCGVRPHLNREAVSALCNIKCQVKSSPPRKED